MGKMPQIRRTAAFSVYSLPNDKLGIHFAFNQDRCRINLSAYLEGVTVRWH